MTENNFLEISDVVSSAISWVGQTSDHITTILDIFDHQKHLLREYWVVFLSKITLSFWVEDMNRIAKFER